MRIVCDSCGTKYSISDEKVRGKLFKFRCKNCSHVIIVRGNEPAASEPDSGAGDTSVSSETVAVADEWFFVLDGEQAGPIATDEVDNYIASGQIDADTYVWREGMDDWLHLVDIPELAHLAAHFDQVAASSDGNGHDAGQSVFAGSGDEVGYSVDEEATRVTATPSDEPAPAPAPTARLFDDGSFGDAPATESLAPSYAGGGDLFEDTETTRPSGAGSALFGAADGMGMSTANDVDSDDRMVGQRNENSVLFSLDTLQSAESENNGSDLPTTEGSGLIDIKALAASQAATGGADVDAAGALSADQPLVTPAVMPMGHRQSHKLLYGAIAAGAVVIIGLVTAIVVVLTQGETPVEAQAATGGEATQQQATPAEPVQAEQTPAVAETDATAQPAGAPEAAAPTAEEIRAASAAAGLMAASVDNDARAAAQAVADRPATRVARSDRDRERSRDRDDDDDDEPRESSQRDDDDDRDRRDRDRRDRDRDRRDRDRSSDGDDPVAAALSTIRGGDDDDDDEPRGSRGGDDEDEAEPASDLPEQLSTSEISRTIRRYGRRLSECRSESDLPSGEVLRVNVSMTLQGNGRVASARTDSSDRAADCIVGVVREMRFDEFSGDAMNFTYPFRVR